MINKAVRMSVFYGVPLLTLYKTVTSKTAGSRVLWGVPTVAAGLLYTAVYAFNGNLSLGANDAPVVKSTSYSNDAEKEYAAQMRKGPSKEYIAKWKASFGREYSTAALKKASVPTLKNALTSFSDINIPLTPDLLAFVQSKATLIRVEIAKREANKIRIMNPEKSEVYLRNQDKILGMDKNTAMIAGGATALLLAVALK